MDCNFLYWIAANELEKRYGSTQAALIVFGSCFGGFVVLMTTIWFAERALSRKRHQRRLSWGQNRGFESLDPDGPDVGQASEPVLAVYPHVPILQINPRGAKSIFAGTYSGEPMRIFDYTYVTGSGKHTAVHNYSVVAIQLPRTYPALIFRKRYVHDRFARLRKETFVTTGHETFDERFRVQWDIDGVLAMRLDGLSVERFSSNLAREYYVSGWQCVIVAHKHISDDAYDQLIDEARWFVDWLSYSRPA